MKAIFTKLFLLILLIASPCFAETVGKYGDWTLECDINQKTYLEECTVFTNFPNDYNGIYDVFGVRLGYNFVVKKKVVGFALTAMLPSSTVDLSEAGTIQIDNSDKIRIDKSPKKVASTFDEEGIKQMLKGEKVSVRLFHHGGYWSTDSFNLKGFSEAFEIAKKRSGID
jgi:invasion protein IalB